MTSLSLLLPRFQRSIDDSMSDFSVLFFCCFTFSIAVYLFHLPVDLLVIVQDRLPRATTKYHVSDGAVRKVFKLRMGVHKPTRPWLLVEDNYVVQQDMRKMLMQKFGNDVLGCKPNALGACKELLDQVIMELLETYPDKFELAYLPGGASGIRVVDTGEVFPTEGLPGLTGPLQTAATLAMEDLNILIRDDQGRHCLYVSLLSG